MIQKIRIANPADPFDRPEVPLPPSAFSGEWLKRDSRKHPTDYPLSGDGEIYALAIVSDDPRGNSHKLRAENFFWEGDEAEFRKQFTAI